MAATAAAQEFNESVAEMGENDEEASTAEAEAAAVWLQTECWVAAAAAGLMQQRSFIIQDGL